MASREAGKIEEGSQKMKIQKRINGQVQRIIFCFYIQYRKLIPFQQQNITVIMDKFRQSRRKASIRKQSPLKLDNLSPEKYGKAAFNEMMYTPSRLAENILYKETVAQKKNEQTASKLRETEAKLKMIEDKFEKVSKEKIGIQQSLSKQIEMYKELIAEMEQKNQLRVKQLQINFKDEINQLIFDKEQEAKFSHAEKQNLQDTIEELQKIANDLDEKLTKTTNNLENMTERKQNLDKQLSNAHEKISAAEEQIKANNQRAQEQIQVLKDKIVETQKAWRDKKDEAVREKEEQMKQAQREHRRQVQKVNEEREAERNQKAQQLKEITATFEAQSKRQSEALASKEKAIQDMKKQSSDSQDKILSLTQGYEQEITNLTHEKCRLFKEVDALNQENGQLNTALRDLQINSAKQKSNLENYILKLKDDISANQIHLLRERDRNSVHFEGSSKEIIQLKKDLASLKNQNVRLKEASQDKGTLAKEVQKLRELLSQSSYELQRCKDEFIKIGKERDFMAAKLEQVHNENSSLRMIKMDREEEAKSWRDSYYLTKATRKY